MLLQRTKAGFLFFVFFLKFFVCSVSFFFFLFLFFIFLFFFAVVGWLGDLVGLFRVGWRGWWVFAFWMDVFGPDRLHPVSRWSSPSFNRYSGGVGVGGTGEVCHAFLFDQGPLGRGCLFHKGFGALVWGGGCGSPQRVITSGGDPDSHI